MIQPKKKICENEESKQKMRKPKSPDHVLKIKANAEKNKKPIIQYNLMGNIIKEWPSASDASRTLNIASQNISCVCKNNRGSAGGYKWQYKIM